MSGIAVDDHGEAHALRDPARDLDTLGHRRGAHVCETGVCADDATGADERNLASRLFHDACVRGARRVKDDQHAIGAMNELLQSRALRPHGADGLHARLDIASTSLMTSTTAGQ